MQVSSHWRTGSLVAGALLLGTIIGPPTAQAAAAGLVRIEGGGRAAHVVSVNKNGQLSVNTGLATTAAGQLKVAAASPADDVFVVGSQSCSPKGIYAIPRGKALVITGVTFFNVAKSAGTAHALSLAAGPAKTPCTVGIAGASAIDTVVTQNQSFTPGIPVPAGDAIGLLGTSDDGAVEVFGYLVPASAVPRKALSQVQALLPSRLVGARPRP